MMSFVLQDGRSPLLTASINGHLDVVTTLIQAGSNVNQGDKVGTCTFMSFTDSRVYLCVDMRCMHLQRGARHRHRIHNIHKIILSLPQFLECCLLCQKIDSCNTKKSQMVVTKRIKVDI